MTDKPTGGETEYDLLNTLVQDEPATVDRTTQMAADNPTWGICRCRMAAVIDTVSRRHGWQSDQERRTLTIARYPSLPRPESNPCRLTPLTDTKTPPTSQMAGIANRGASL